MMLLQRPAFKLAALLVLATLLRLFTIDAQGLWFDELFGIYYTRAPLAEMLRGIALEGTKFPFYYTVVHFLTGLGPPELVVRLYSTGWALLSIPLIYNLGKVLLSERAGWWAAVVLALNPFHVFFSQEARPYTLLMFLALLAMYVFVKLTRRITAGLLVALTVAHALLLLTNLFGLLIPFVQFIFMITDLRRHRRLFRRWYVVNIIAVIPLLLWYGYGYIARGSLRFSAAWMPLTTIVDLPLTLQNFLLGNLEGFHVLIVVAAGVLLVWALRRTPKPARKMLLLWLFPIVIVWLVGTRRNIYGDRYLIVTLPALLLLFGYALSVLPRRVGLAIRAVAVVILLIGVVQVYSSPLYRKDQWREAARWVAANEQARDAIVTTTPPSAIAIDFYYPGKLTVQLATDETNAAQPLALAGIDRVWIIVGYVELSGHAVAQPFFLRDGLDSPRTLIGADLPGFRFVESRIFNGVSVALFARNT
jgi:mannosyltransferase